MPTDKELRSNRARIASCYRYYYYYQLFKKKGSGLPERARSDVKNMTVPSSYGSIRTRQTADCGASGDLAGLTGHGTPVASLGKLRPRGRRKLAQGRWSRPTWQGPGRVGCTLPVQLSYAALIPNWMDCVRLHLTLPDPSLLEGWHPPATCVHLHGARERLWAQGT